MLERIEKSGPEITIEEIRKIEELFGFKLPIDYINFMLKYNGGRPIPDAFWLGDDPEDISGIHTFYSLNIETKSGNLLEAIKVLNGRMPKGIFPIAFTDTGDCVCLDLNKENYGKVYWWDHERETMPPSYENTCLVCNSFGDLLDRLFQD